ncbi:MAG TPA: RNA polymerase factor sigma-32 [Myxococcaceae bacterium]|nr:RNA polymerase factor sigma-32 [Myxococcaceae bacterium]
MATRKKTGDAPKSARARKPRAAPPREPPADAEIVEAEPAETPPLEPEAFPEPEPDAAVMPEADGDAEASPSTAIVSASDPALTRRDPLAAYMAEVNRHPLLSREEEHALAVRFRQTGDFQAAYELVAANLRLVVKLAHEYHRNPLSLLDLIQEGNIGLMQAVKKYDPYRGVKLSTYAAWWIRAYILRYIMDNWKMVKLGTTEAQRKLFFKLRQEQDRLSNQGIEVTPKLLAERLDVTEQDIIEMDQRLGPDEVSLDAPLPDESRTPRIDRMLPSSAPGADEALGNEELKRLFREKVNEFAAGLKDKDRFIFEHRLMTDEPMTLQEIGDRYGVSRERARQLEAALINRMRQYMREHIPDFDLVAMPKD